MTNCSEALAHYSAKNVKDRLCNITGKFVNDDGGDFTIDECITYIENRMHELNNDLALAGRREKHQQERIDSLVHDNEILANQIGIGCLISGDTTAAHIVIRSLMGELDRLQANDGQMSALHKMDVENANKQITALKEEIEKQKNEIEMWSNKYGLVKKRLNCMLEVIKQEYDKTYNVIYEEPEIELELD